MLKKPRKPQKLIGAKQRAKDEKLREELRRFDIKQFDKALEKAIGPVPHG